MFCDLGRVLGNEGAHAIDQPPNLVSVVLALERLHTVGRIVADRKPRPDLMADRLTIDVLLRPYPVSQHGRLLWLPPSVQSRHAVPRSKLPKVMLQTRTRQHA